MTTKELTRQERRLYLEAMELAQRIVRNALIDVDELALEVQQGELPETTIACVLEARRQQCFNVLSMLRHVQVEVGAGRLPIPALTPDEHDNIDRIF